MSYIEQSITKVDHYDKVSGLAKYVADYKIKNMYYGAMVRSERVHAKILNIIYPEMESEYFTVDSTDMTTPNYLRNSEDGQRIYAQDEVNYIGEAIAMICGPNKQLVKKYAAMTVVEYEDLPAITDYHEATKVQVSYGGEKGDAAKAFEEAALVYEETFTTGYQEHVYLETNGMIAEWKNQKMTIIGSMQNPYYIKNEVAHVFELEEDQVRVKMATTGGGFGGKEDYPSLVAAQTALAAMKSGHAVSFILDRKEDVTDSVKRHPADLKLKAALNADKQITALDVDFTYDGGAYQTVSGTVMQRGLITSTGVYDIPNVKLFGKVVKTNTVPTGAFRGFGAPKSFFAIEGFMNHLAAHIGEDSKQFKERHMVVQGSSTSTGGVFAYPIMLPQMIEKANELTNYDQKRRQYENQTGRMRKGIGISYQHHGCGFTGSAEKDFLKSVAALQKYSDGTVEILVSNTDIGQGLRTTFSKIVADALEISIDRVITANPDTDRVPNSGPTVASRSVMIVGKLLERAALQLKEEWIDGEDQRVEQHYMHPDMIPWDLETFSGDPYPTYSWGVNVVEVEVDTLTGETTIIDACGIYDVGKPMDPMIIRGQIEGGFLQGMGYGFMENMQQKDGRILQTSYSTYMVPTSMDVSRIKSATVENHYKNGPFGGKGAGELTLLGGAPAVIQAIEQAIGAQFTTQPVTPERIIQALQKKEGI